jgi:flagellar basal-body rod protein FlgF
MVLRMNVSLYQAAAAMNATSRWQEMIAENLAASSVPGARKLDISFAGFEAGYSPVVNGSRPVIPAAHTTINFQQGAIRPGGPMDFAIDGPGFFAVQLPNGEQGYTRDGVFQVNAQSQLVTKQGHLVLSDGGPIQFDPNNPSPITISSTGEVSQGADVKGRLSLTEFNNPQFLTGVGGGIYLGNNPKLEKSDTSTSSIRQGFVEASNTSPTTEMASLVTAMRMFEANQRVLSMQDERMGRMIHELTGQ